jgi:hypothetical protein
VEGVVLLLSYLIKMTRITLSSLSGKIVVVQPPPQEPQTSNIGPIAGGISGVVVAIVLVVIRAIFMW